MKILVLQDYLRSGGTERQAVLLANAFASAGHTVTLLTFRPGGPLAGTVATNVDRRSLQPFDTHLDWFAPGLTRFVTRTLPDIVLCMGRMANCYAGALSVAEVGTEFLDELNLAPLRVVSTMRTGKRLPWRYRQGLKCANHIVANSHEAARVLSDNYAIPAPKISVIHNSLVFPSASASASASDVGGVPPPRSGDATFSSLSAISRETLRAQHSATPSTTVLLCVAMFRPEKNQRALISLAAHVPRDTDWQLWLVGEGETRAACTALAQQLGLADRVKFLGFQSDPAPLYRAADVAMLTSQSESLPNFLIEAQSHGLPVVAFEVGGVRECFIPGETGWAVAPGDDTAFLAALAPLLADPNRRAALAAPARAFAHSAFAPAGQAQRYLDLFARLTTRP